MIIVKQEEVNRYLDSYYALLTAITGRKKDEFTRLSNDDIQVIDVLIGQVNIAYEYRDLLKMRFGINCPKYTFEQLGHHFNRSRERVRQILNKTLRSLRHEKFFKYWEVYFMPETELAAAKDTTDASKVPIEELNISVRSINALKNLGIKTLDQVTALREWEILKCKNFGRKNLAEIKEVLKSYGLALKTAKDTTDASEVPIEELYISVRSTNALKNLGITTLDQVTELREWEILKCKNFGRKSLAEIKEVLKAYGLALKKE